MLGRDSFLVVWGKKQSSRESPSLRRISHAKTILATSPTETAAKAQSAVRLEGVNSVGRVYRRCWSQKKILQKAQEPTIQLA